MPTRFTSPGSPRALSSATTKSRNALARALELRADAGLVGREPLRAEAWQVAARSLGEGLGLLRVDRVVERVHVGRVGPEAHAAAEVERHVHAEARGAVHRVDQAAEAERRARREREVVALAGMLAIARRVDVDARERGDAVGGEARGVHERRRFDARRRLARRARASRASSSRRRSTSRSVLRSSSTPPALSSSAASERQSPCASTMPVRGERRPATARTAGSRARDLGAVHERETGRAVRAAARAQVLEHAHLGLARRDDQLAELRGAGSPRAAQRS